MRCEYLPPYSPDFNPIKLAFSYMKYSLCQNGEYEQIAMTEMTDADIYFHS
jgi:transposase